MPAIPWRASVQCLIQTGQQHQGLWPSLLDRQGQMPALTPPAICGQRQHDRSPRGCNLMHDVELVGALLLLTQATGEACFGEAAQRYLRRFMDRCTRTPTGLFAWGEHAYWDLDHDALGNGNAHANRTVSRGAYHDHLREAPPWLWRRLWTIDAAAVRRFASALRWHWKSGALEHEYWRHAYMECPHLPLPHEAISRDFPRHGGFYLLDTAFVLSRQADHELMAQAARLAHYWSPYRHGSGLLPIQSRSEPDIPSERAYSVGQTISLGVNMLDAAPLLRQGGQAALARTVEQLACHYLQGCLAAPHRPQDGLFVQAVERKTFTQLSAYAAWGTRYGDAAAVGSLAGWLLRAARHTGDQRFLQLARQAIDWAQSQPLPRDLSVCARDLAQILRAAIDLHLLDPSAEARAAIVHFVALAKALFMDAPLPRAALGCDWYEAQLGSSDLLAALIHADLNLAQCPAGTWALESLQ